MLTTINPNDLIGNAGLCGGVLPPCTTTSSAIKATRESAHQARHTRGFIIVVSIFLTQGIASFSLGDGFIKDGICTTVFIDDRHNKSKQGMALDISSIPANKFTPVEIY
ncbi:hypothetical protein NC652_031004 [Populus alba x Populus x berolinensis]|nr:hypothetical protein NC652_031004 [Populus alba x Populus x berolinensis]